MQTPTSNSTQTPVRENQVNNPPTATPIPEAPVHLFMTRSSGARKANGALPSDEERKEAAKHLRLLESQGATTTEAVEYLLSMNWSTAAIREAVRYPSETKGHKKGDQLLPQHVNAIRTRWMQKRQAEQQAALRTKTA